MQITGVRCVFCGKTIEPIPPDICTLTLRTRVQERLPNNPKEPTQELYCHAACLKERVQKDTALLSDLLGVDD